MAKGTIRWVERLQAWEVRLDLGRDPVTKERRRQSRTLRAPNDKQGRSQAEGLLAKMRVEKDEGTVTGSSSTISQCAESWWRRGEGDWSPTTARGYRRILDVQIIPRWGDVELREIRRGEIIAWHDHLLRKTSLPTVRRYHAVLRSVLNHAVEREWLAANPAAGRLLRAERRAELSPPSPEELRRVLAEIGESRSEWAAFFRIAALCGLRRSEMCGLQWGDVDLEDGWLTVRRAVVQVGQERVVKGTKTHQVRTMAIGPGVVAIFQSLGPGPADAFVWSDAPDGLTPLLPGTATQAWVRLRDRAGVKCRLHDLRHFMATELLAQGEAIPTVQARLGHRKASTTLDIYAHAIPSRDRAAASLIEVVTLGDPG